MPVDIKLKNLVAITFTKEKGGYSMKAIQLIDSLPKEIEKYLEGIAEF